MRVGLLNVITVVISMTKTKMNEKSIQELKAKSWKIIDTVDSYEPKETDIWAPWKNNAWYKFILIDEVYYVVMRRGDKK